ncbi:MAG: DUF4127 family protein [Microbacteriaceae bacterium]|nr:DUF4127 family protein [Microbacteriaceae bacterium]
MRIALVPLDERPVNTELPRQVAAIAGVELLLPPADAMPSFRTAADTAAIADWLRGVAGDVDHVVACIDTVVYGGIIPARITGDDPAESLRRLAVFRELAMRPDLRIAAAALVMRASDSYSNLEEPEYWDRHGRDIHALGGRLHRALIADAVGQQPDDAPETTVPDTIRGDFQRRRLRNHLVNLAALGLYEEGVLDALTLTADDTAEHSAGSAEQLWLRHWMRALPHANGVLMYPGADEVGAVLVARALCSGLPGPRWRVVCAEPDGLERVPKYENLPVQDSLARQLQAAGGRVASADERADLTLVVHAPDPARGDCFDAVPESDPAATAATAAAVESALDTGAVVALADIRFTNGADPALVDLLAERGLLLRLSAYAGWNTAGNSIGSAVATASAVWAGGQRGTLDTDAVERALLTRVLDDRVYQSGVRVALHGIPYPERSGLLEPDAQASAEARIRRELQHHLDTAFPGATDWTVARVTLPWRRRFEIGVDLVRSAAG